MKDYKKITIESYDKTVDEYIDKVDRLHPHKESKKFLSLLKKNSLILDLGCGPGRDAKIFADKGFKVIGVDLSNKMLEAAERRVKNTEFKLMDTMKLDFKDSLFDAIWASGIFVHIPKKEMPNAMKEPYRVLKKDGILYLSVKEGKGEILEPDNRYGGVKKFWSFFEKGEIEDILEKIGFAILECNIKKQDDSYRTHPWIHIFCKK